MMDRLWRRVRRVVCRHRAEVAATVPDSPVVALSCRGCGRVREVPSPECRHRRIAASIPGSEPGVVELTCVDCGAVWMVPLVGGLPVWVPDGAALIDADTLCLLQASNLVERAFADLSSPW